MTLSIFSSYSNYYEDASLFVGSNNIELIIDTKLNLEDAITTELRVKIPQDEDNEVTWIGEVVEDTCIKYLIKTDDIPVPGIYIINSYIEFDEEADEGEIPDELNRTKLFGETALLKVKAIGE